MYLSLGCDFASWRRQEAGQSEEWAKLFWPTPGARSSHGPDFARVKIVGSCFLAACQPSLFLYGCYYNWVEQEGEVEEEEHF